MICTGAEHQSHAQKYQTVCLGAPGPITLKSYVKSDLGLIILVFGRSATADLFADLAGEFENIHCRCQKHGVMCIRLQGIN